jgi:hypothetical protein
MPDSLAALCVICHDRPPVGTSYLCGGDYARLRTDLALTAWAHWWLGRAMVTPAPAWKPGAIHHAATEGQPPFPVALLDARSAIEAVLGSWARMIAEEHTPALAGPADGGVESVVRWLRARLPWCSDQPWVDDYARELAELRQQAHGLVPWSRARRDLPVPCPACGLLSLSAYSGDDAIVCRSHDCGRVVAWVEYEHAVRREWDDEMRRQQAPREMETAA